MKIKCPKCGGMGSREVFLGNDCGGSHYGREECETCNGSRYLEISEDDIITKEKEYNIREVDSCMNCKFDEGDGLVGCDITDYNPDDHLPMICNQFERED